MAEDGFLVWEKLNELICVYAVGDYFEFKILAVFSIMNSPAGSNLFIIERINATPSNPKRYFFHNSNVFLTIKHKMSNKINFIHKIWT